MSTATVTTVCPAPISFASAIAPATLSPGDVPAKMSYEIELDAQRVDGTDFFCGLTFPVNDDCASLIVGGWGGGLCGISCLDLNDAANNDTTTIREFKSKTWYHIRLRVIPDRLMAWIDDKKIVDVNTKGKKITVRHEVDAVVAALATVGYVPCVDDGYEPGFEKAAVYARSGLPTHAARQLADGRWSSKMGQDCTVSHATPSGVEGLVYGSVVAYLRRPIA